MKPMRTLLEKARAVRRKPVLSASFFSAACRRLPAFLCKRFSHLFKSGTIQRLAELHKHFAWHRLAGAFFVLAMLVLTYQSGVLLERSSIMAERNLLIHAQQQADDARQLTISQARLLAKELGIMQARIRRLEILGQRLAESQNLGGEFDFSDSPGVGGGSPPLLPPQSDTDADELSAVIRQLGPHAAYLEMQLAMIGDLIEQRKLKVGMMPHGWPVEHGWISSDFGRRKSPFTGRLEMHEGIDIVSREGAPILAVAGGVVRMAKMSRDYGYIVEIDHGNGYSTRYAHNKINLVREGDVVRQGSVIARLGSTGRSTGNHLHFEVLKHGRPIDPKTYLKRP